MSEASKRWQTTIWIADDSPRPTTFFGETLEQLSGAVSAWLRDQQPRRFSNSDPSAEETGAIHYAYDDGRLGLGHLMTEMTGRNNEGWYRATGRKQFWMPTSTDTDLEAIAEAFIRREMIIEKGPDYQELAVPGKEFPLPLIKTIRDVEDKSTVNEMLQRGWYLIAIEYISNGEGRDAVFTLGHPEERPW